MNASIQTDSEATELRRRRLESYLADNVFREEQMVCGAYSDCVRARDRQHVTFYKGQAPHLGGCYDLRVEGVPFRVVVVGQEYGHKGNFKSLDSRRKMVTEAALKPFRGVKPRNPHMRGTTSLLRFLVGRNAGTDPAGELLRIDDGREVHLFETFALVNFLMCSAVGLGTRRTKSTAAMKAHCAHHFKEILRILEPSVIVVQSESYFPAIRGVFDRLTPAAPNLWRAEMDGNRSLLASFAHPASKFPKNWGANDRTEYLRTVVAPAIQCLRAIAFEGVP